MFVLIKACAKINKSQKFTPHSFLSSCKTFSADFHFAPDSEECPRQNAKLRCFILLQSSGLVADNIVFTGGEDLLLK